MIQKANLRVLLLLVTAVATVPVCAQVSESNQVEISRVQWANASSFALKFTMLGSVVSDSWRAGGQVSGAATDGLNWSATFTPPLPLPELTEKFKLKSGENCAAVLIGDFTKVDLTDPSELPSGHTRLDDKTAVRAALLRLPIPRNAQGELPVYVVNGDPENALRISEEGGAALDVKYGKPTVFKTRPMSFKKIRVNATGIDEELGFSLEDNQSGVVVAFFRTQGEEQTQFVFVNLYSMAPIPEPKTLESANE
jgi:hypothetical protein